MPSTETSKPENRGLEAKHFEQVLHASVWCISFPDWLSSANSMSPFPPLPVSNQIYHELCGPWAGDLSPDTCEILQIPRGSLSGRKDGCVYLGSRDRQG